MWNLRYKIKPKSMNNTIDVWSDSFLAKFFFYKKYIYIYLYM